MLVPPTQAPCFFLNLRKGSRDGRNQRASGDLRGSGVARWSSAEPRGDCVATSARLVISCPQRHTAQLVVSLSFSAAGATCRRPEMTRRSSSERPTVSRTFYLRRSDDLTDGRFCHWTGSRAGRRRLR